MILASGKTRAGTLINSRFIETSKSVIMGFISCSLYRRILTHHLQRILRSCMTFEQQRKLSSFSDREFILLMSFAQVQRNKHSLKGDLDFLVCRC